MSVVRRIMANLLHHYEGALVGALVGDCLGAPFEFEFGDKEIEWRRGKITKLFKSIDAGKKKGKYCYTDDTAMLRSVARSLIVSKKFDATDLSQRFTTEFFEEPERGYGRNIPVVFQELKESKFEDPFGPAARQFDGSGSHGNGGAMRIAPAGLFGLHFSEEDFNTLVSNITRITHSNALAINGAILEASAVQMALKSAMSDAPLTCDQLMAQLEERIKHLESTTDETQPEKEKPYCEKLDKMKEFLKQKPEPDADDVADELGNDVSALKSVPAAVFSFLRTLGRPPEGWEKSLNDFQRTIVYAISLGGDTDTIASMAGAIAGAYLGISGIPKEWQDACEGLEDARTMAHELFELVEQSRTSKV